MKNNNRLQGEYQKVGIRPTIDGRLDGVRESLEKQTYDMAKSAADLISGTLRYPNGEKVVCVIADTTIGGVAESAACAAKFDKEGVGVSLTVTPCWCYGTETMDMDPLRPKAVWGFNGTERPGAVYLAAVLAGHNQKGLPASIMKGKSYLSLGSVSMGIADSVVNEDFFQDYLGIRNEYVDMSEFIRRLNLDIFDQEEFEKAMAWTKENCREGEDPNKPENQHTREEKDKEWETSVKMALIARDLMIGNPVLKDMGWGEEALGHNAIAAGFQGQRYWTDFMPNGDFMETILNTSFDWNGIREAFVFATENDSLNGATMLFGHLLTGTAQIISDVRTYWSAAAVKKATGKTLTGKGEGGLIHLINSGSTTLDGAGEMTENGKPVMKQFWDITEDDVKKSLEATEFCPADLGYFRGGGYSTDFLTKGDMPVTMSRINLVKGQGPVLQIAEGYTVEIEQEVHDILDKRTNPTWPTTWFAPHLTGTGAFKDVYSVMANWGANHGAISYGHIGADLIALASILRIPVNMHNVDEDKIFRPLAWASFGMDKEGSDYRACANFGPLYGFKK